MPRARPGPASVTLPAVSVVVVNYNAGEFLARALDALSAPSVLALEIILVDNASSDGSVAAARARHPGVVVLENPANLGFARGANQGLKAARGAYLVLLNPDSECPPATLEALVAFLHTHPRVGVVGPRLVNPDGSLQPSAYAFPGVAQVAAHLFGLGAVLPAAAMRRLGRHAGPLGRVVGRVIGQLDPHERPRPVDWVTGACFAIRRECWEAVGQFDERFFLYHEEQDYCRRVRDAGFEVYHVPTATVLHHVGGSARHRPWESLVDRYRSLLHYFAKHAPGRLPIVRTLLVATAVVREVGFRLGGWLGLLPPAHARAGAAAWRQVRALRLGGSGAGLSRSAAQSLEGSPLDCSVVIVNYRTDQLLGECLASLKKTTANLAVEVIVVDNGATLAAGELADQFPRLQLLQNAANVGFARASNQGIRLARGRHFLLLNPDTVVHEGAVEAMVGHLDAHPEVGAVGARLLDPDGSLQYSCRRFPGYLTIFFGRYALLTRLLPRNRASRDYLYLDWDHQNVREVDWVSGACLMVRREVMERVGALDEGYFLFVEDMDLCRRMRDAGWPVVYLPQAVVTHRIGVSRGPVPAWVVWARHRGMLRYVRKHFRPPGPVAALIAAALGIRAGLHVLADAARRRR